MAETLIKPAGHESQEVRTYDHPSDDLVGRCSELLDSHSDGHSDSYSRAVRLLDGIAPSVEAANAMLLDRRLMRHPNFGLAGVFASAIYNRIQPPVLVHDLDTPDMLSVGYKFPGILINTGRAGAGFGDGAQVVINLGSLKGLSAHLAIDTQYLDIEISMSRQHWFDVRDDNQLNWQHFDRDKESFVTKRVMNPGLVTYAQGLVDCARRNPHDLVKFGTAWEIKKKAYALAGLQQ